MIGVTITSDKPMPSWWLDEKERVTDSTANKMRRVKKKPRGIRVSPSLMWKTLSIKDTVQPTETLVFPKWVKPNTWWLLKTPKSLKPIGALLNLSGFAHSCPIHKLCYRLRFLLLVCQRPVCGCCGIPRWMSHVWWLLWAGAWLPPHLTPSSGSRQNYTIALSFDRPRWPRRGFQLTRLDDLKTHFWLVV